MKSEKIDTVAMLRGEGDDANGTDRARRDADLRRVRDYYPEEFLRRIADGEIGAPPWRLLLDPTSWPEISPDYVVDFYRSFFEDHARWPNLDDVRKRFGRVSNHRGPGEAEGQGALL